jgi:hypothetical protein
MLSLDSSLSRILQIRQDAGSGYHSETAKALSSRISINRITTQARGRSNDRNGINRGIGEIVGSSTRSPMASRLAWKAEHPNEGYLPGVYAPAAEYRVPILLHIDPPTGMPIVKLEEALEQNPDTMIIFAHANAYTPPENIAPLLRDHPNLYKVSYLDYLQIIEAQPPTETQLERVAELPDQLDEHHTTNGLNKRQVHELIFELDRIADATRDN